MSYRVLVDPVALRQIDDFAGYLQGYSESFAAAQVARLDHAITHAIGATPLRWPIFSLAGPPYRAYLFRVGRRTQFWIVYRVTEETRTVDILKFWNAMRDPRTARP